MTTATKRRTAAAPSTAVRDLFEERIDQAVADWRRWAADLATGKPGPAPQAILEAAAVLAIRDPGVVLEKDAAAYASIATHERRADTTQERMQAAIDAHGGRDAIGERIATLRDELRQLEAAIGPGAAMALGGLRGEVTGMKNRNPRLFANTYRGEGLKQ
jgi:hypothetical protein